MTIHDYIERALKGKSIIQPGKRKPRKIRFVHLVEADDYSSGLICDVEFDDGWGGSEGPHVLIWTADRVYFPVVYDGSEWLGSAPRNPQAEGQRHVGGE